MAESTVAIALVCIMIIATAFSKLDIEDVGVGWREGGDRIDQFGWKILLDHHIYAFQLTVIQKHTKENYCFF